jgi:hypothetical protein
LRIIDVSVRSMSDVRCRNFNEFVIISINIIYVVDNVINLEYIGTVTVEWLAGVTRILEYRVLYIDMGGLAFVIHILEYRVLCFDKGCASYSHSIHCHASTGFIVPTHSAV